MKLSNGRKIEEHTIGLSDGNGDTYFVVSGGAETSVTTVVIDSEHEDDPRVPVGAEVWTYGIDGRYSPPSMRIVQPDERRELADIMVKRWQRWGGLNIPMVKRWQRWGGLNIPMPEFAATYRTQEEKIRDPLALVDDIILPTGALASKAPPVALLSSESPPAIEVTSETPHIRQYRWLHAQAEEANERRVKAVEAAEAAASSGALTSPVWMREAGDEWATRRGVLLEQAVALMASEPYQAEVRIARKNARPASAPTAVIDGVTWIYFDEPSEVVARRLAGLFANLNERLKVLEAVGRPSGQASLQAALDRASDERDKRDGHRPVYDKINNDLRPSTTAPTVALFTQTLPPYDKINPPPTVPTSERDATRAEVDAQRARMLDRGRDDGFFVVLRDFLVLTRKVVWFAARDWVHSNTIDQARGLLHEHDSAWLKALDAAVELYVTPGDRTTFEQCAPQWDAP